jgi:hypothetical protein
MFVCVCRWSLAVVHSTNAVSYLKNQFKSDLQSIYQFFDQSSSRSAMLRSLQQSLQDDELKIAKVGDTRWLRYDLAFQLALTTVCVCVLRQPRKVYQYDRTLPPLLVHVLAGTVIFCNKEQW